MQRVRDAFFFHWQNALFSSLIQRMLVRDPAKRPTLGQLIKNAWVKAGDRGFAQSLPLVSRTTLSDCAHATIVEQMVVGGIGSEERILKCVCVFPSHLLSSSCRFSSAIEQGEYSYLTATYYLLAERVLSAHRIEQSLKLREQAAAANMSDIEEEFASSSHQNASSTSTTAPMRSRSNSWRGPRRACTILKEESEEELSSYLRSSSRQSSRSVRFVNRVVYLFLNV